MKEKIIKSKNGHFLCIDCVTIRKSFFHFMPFCNLDLLFYWSPTIFYAPQKIWRENIQCSRGLVRPSVHTSHSCPAHSCPASSYPALNFIIWSQISKLFYRNDHHVETTCRTQHLGPYLEGHGHCATLQQNPV